MRRLALVLLPLTILAIVWWLLDTGPPPTPAAVVADEVTTPRAPAEREGAPRRLAEAPSPAEVEIEDDEALDASPPDPAADAVASAPVPEYWDVPTEDRVESPAGGLVLDVRTGEPVPDLDLVLRRPDRTILAETGPDGELRFRGEPPDGPVAVTVRDAGKTVNHALVRDGGPGAPWLRVAIGPTCPLLLPAVDPDPANWEARIVETRQEPGTPANIEVLEDGLSLGSRGHIAADLWQEADRPWPWTRVRPGSPAWVRYAEHHWEPEPDFQAFLELRHATGVLRGLARLGSTIGIQPTVRVEVSKAEPLGTLVGRFLQPPDTGGSSWREGTVLLLPTPAERESTDAPPFFAEQTADSQGRFRIEGIPTGKREILLWAMSQPIRRETLDIQPGTVDLGDVSLGRYADVGMLIRLWHDEPWPEGARYMSRLTLSAAGPYARAWWDYCSYSGGVEKLLFTDLPLAEFEQVGIGLRMAPHWKPTSLVLESRLHFGIDEPRDLEVVSAEARPPLGFEVTDAKESTPIERFRVYFGPGGTMALQASATSDWRCDPAPDAPLAWTVWAPGHAPAFGTEADFQEKDGERIAAVALNPGWGAFLCFRAGDPRRIPDEPPWDKSWIRLNSDWIPRFGGWAAPPLPRVRVLADGEPIATSDAEGHARLSLPERPKELTIVSPGWQIAALQRVEDFGEGDLPYRYLVWMDRE